MKITIPEAVAAEIKKAKKDLVKAHGERVYEGMLAGEYSPPEVHALLEKAGCR